MSSEAISFPPQVLGERSDGRNDLLERDCSGQQFATQAPVSGRTDEALIRGVTDRDKEALSLLFSRYARRVRNVVYRIVKDEQEAEDLVQEVFLFIFRKADQFNPELGSAASWIVHIAYHRAFDRRRYLISRHFYDGLELDEYAIRSVAAQPSTLLAAGTMQEILGKDLMKRYEQRLSTGQRRVIELYFLGGHTFDEIAEITGVSLANIRSHYYRGLERLRRYVLPDTIRTQ